MNTSEPNPILYKIIWIVFLSTSFVYLAIVSFLLEPSSGGFHFDLSNPIEMGFTATGLLCLGVAFGIPRTNLNNAVNKFVMYILRLVFCELAVILALAVAFVTRDISSFYPLFSLGVLGILLLFPKNISSRQRSSGSMGLS